MRIDVSILPALAAAYLLVFARIGTMIMLLPGFGEMSVPVRVRLALALLLTAVFLPLHREAYAIDLRATGPVLMMLGQEMLIGAVLGMTARLTISALNVAGRGGGAADGPRLRHRGRPDAGTAECHRR
jgi:flagellar biosynthetic protein FliR